MTREPKSDADKSRCVFGLPVSDEAIGRYADIIRQKLQGPIADRTVGVGMAADVLGAYQNLREQLAAFETESHRDYQELEAQLGAVTLRVDKAEAALAAAQTVDDAMVERFASNYFINWASFVDEVKSRTREGLRSALVAALAPEPPQSHDQACGGEESDAVWLMGAEQSPFAWCAPGDDNRQRWVLRFEDADRGDMHFDNEHDARVAFEKANSNWTCHLFCTAARRASQPADVVAAVERLRDALRKIAGGDVNNAITLALAERWRELYGELQKIAKDALAPAPEPSRKPTAWNSDMDAAPHNERLILSHQCPHTKKWVIEVDFASHGWRQGSVSNISRHGYATHWMPLPAPPTREPSR